VRTLLFGSIFLLSATVASRPALGQEDVPSASMAVDAIEADVSSILGATTRFDTTRAKPSDNAARILAPYGFTPASLDLFPAESRPAAEEEEDQEDAQEHAGGAVYDAWGAKRNFWLASGEVFGINLFVWAANEYIRGAGFTQVSPRSWLKNIGDGFFYDDNHFNNNQFAHPFHGSLYYSAARSNGYGYWASAPFAIAGSYMWECCGETHAPAINDWIATGIGGIAIGESLYRISGTILDNTATGMERTLREIGGFATNPLRGFNRLVSGRASKVYENPKDAEDWRALSRSINLTTGVRVIGEGNSISEDTKVGAFFEMNFRFGSPFAKQRRKPFDVFTFNVEGVTGQESFMTRLTIRGNLYATDLKRSEKTQHVFSVYQNYDYWNNTAYEFGGQSFSAGIDSRWGLSSKLNLATQISGDFMLMGAVSSDFAFVADLPDVENLRDYDYGVGGGGRILAYLFGARDFRYAAIGYRYTFLNTLNGSVVNGSDAYHHIHMGWLQGRVPLGKTFSIGADWFVFLRDSRYSFTLFENTTQRNPQVRVFATWRTGFGSAN
jgi:hypothetical protein